MAQQMIALFGKELLDICEKVEDILERSKAIERWELQDSIIYSNLLLLKGYLKCDCEQLSYFTLKESYENFGIKYQLPLLTAKEYAEIRLLLEHNPNILEGEKNLCDRILKKIELEKKDIFCNDLKKQNPNKGSD